jgi:hypothetical protein
MPTTAARAKFWPRALAMFAAQDWPNRELVTVDDVVFAGTIGAKLNYGAQVASGEILIRWDDDDWNAPNRITTQVRHMQLTGKPVVGFSSLTYHREGTDYGWEYTGDAWYASGSTHCYTREWALAHPMANKSLSEDNDFVAEAHRLNALSTMSGQSVLVACTHDANTSPRQDHGLGDLIYTADNFRRVPLAEFAAIVAPR